MSKRGYWLLSADNAIFSSPSGGAYCRIVPLSTDEPFGRIIAENRTLEFGVSSWSETGLDPLDKGIPPHPPEAGEGWSPVLVADDVHLSRSISPDGAWELYMPVDGRISIEVPENISALSIDDQLYNEGSTIELEAGYHKLTAETVTPAAIEITGAWPNPFNAAIEIGFSEYLENAIVSIYDVMGNRLTEIPVNGTSIHWDGLTSAGAQLPSGIYMIRLESEKGIDIKRVMLIR